MSLSARPPPITTYGKTTNIYLLVTFCPDSWAVRGEDVVRSTLFDHRMAHFSTTPATAGSGDTIRFGSLEFPALSPTRMWVPPVFTPSQAFLFKSLNFVADRLGVLHLREEARDLAPIEGTSSIDSGTRDFDDAASMLHSEQTLCPNLAMSNIHVVVYLLCSIFR